MKFEIINPEDIPEDLPPGEYTTQIVSADWDAMKLKFIGDKYDSNIPNCLIPVIKDEN